LTTGHKITANRENARASTGPKTALGRARIAQNALRHALSLPVYYEPGLSEEVEALAREIAGADASTEIRELAHRVAEAHVDLRRVRSVRHQLLARKLTDPHYDSSANTPKNLAPIGSLPLSLQGLTEFLHHLPQGLEATLEVPNKFATILAQEARRLLVMDRYERRALSRRKFAIRALDEARRRNASNSKL
jgi:hypothetical protein